MVVAGRNVSLAAIIAGIGAIVAIVVTPLTWASATIGGETQDLKGFDSGMNGGLAEVILGIIALVLVAGWILNVKLPSVAGLPTLALLTLVAGVLILGVATAVYFTNWFGEESLSDMADMMTKAGGSVSLGLAFFLEVIAGILVIVGGGWGLIKKS
jgi:hypothetical protein